MAYEKTGTSYCCQIGSQMIGEKEMENDENYCPDNQVTYFEVTQG